MGLRLDAAAHARGFLENVVDFSWPITLTSPAGVETAYQGYTTDVASIVDPETGVAVVGRRASAVISMLSLTELPVVVHDAGARPWLATFADAAGNVQTWKVIEVRPDRVLMIVVLILGGYGAD